MSSKPASSSLLVPGLLAINWYFRVSSVALGITRHPMKRTFLAVMIFALPVFLTGSRPSSAAELTTRIDESVVAVWKREKVVPAPPTNDS